MYHWRVDIPYERGLLGHWMPMCCARLSRRHSGRLPRGRHRQVYFPDTDPAYEGADSMGCSLA